MATQRILIVGSGVVGKVLGGRLHRAGHQVTFLARQHQVKALQENGIRLQGKGADLEVSALQVSSDLLMFDTFDWVLICVRGHQRDAVFGLLERQPNLSRKFAWCIPLWWFETDKFTRHPGSHHLFLPGFGAILRKDHIEVKMRRSSLCPLGGESVQEALSLADLFDSCGVPVRVKNNLPEQVSVALTILFPLLVGLETKGFSVNVLCRDKERVRAVVHAQREALSIAHAGGLATGRIGVLVVRLPVGVLAGLLRLGLCLARGFNRDLLERHFKKTRDQQTYMLQVLLDAPFADECDAPCLKQLLELAEAVRES